MFIDEADGRYIGLRFKIPLKLILNDMLNNASGEVSFLAA